MKMIQNCGRGIAFILLSFWGLLSTFSVKAAPVLNYGGEIVATNIGPLAYTEGRNYLLNQVDGVRFETTYSTIYNPGSVVHVVIRCGDNIETLINRDPTQSPGSLSIYPDGNGTGAGWVLVLTPHSSGDNSVSITDFGWSNNQLRISLYHELKLRVYMLNKPFDVIQDAVFQCGAFRNMSGSGKDLVSMTYFTLRVTNLATVAVPSISAPKQLNLKECQAGSSKVLSEILPVTLSHEGQHNTLSGTLTAQVSRDRDNPQKTDNLTITTESGHDLTQGVNIPSTMKGDYPLKVSVSCPDIGGTYNWLASLTYTID